MKQECKEFKAFYDGIGKVGKWSCNYHDYDETVTQMRWEDVKVISLRGKCLNAST